jgi:hypothetical protein
MEITGLEAEEVTLRAFVVAHRRDRLASVVRTKKRYRELVGWLSHAAQWDPRWVSPVPVAEQQPDAIERILRSLGAPDECHVLGGAGGIDGQDLPLFEALDFVVGSICGTLVICIPGRLAYHEGEERNDRNVLHRPVPL